MSADKNYEEILEEVCAKLKNLDSINEIDIIDIKNSIETIENIMTDTQAKLNFEEIKEKLENIAFQVDNCNDSLLKNLYDDINELKESSSSVSQYIENLQNVQNLALTSAEFEEFQKQQLDLALKTNENIFNQLAEIKEKSKTIGSSENVTKLENQLENLHKNLSAYVEQMADKIESIPSLENIGAIVSDLNSVQQKSIKQTNTLVKELQNRFKAFEENQENKDIENQISKLAEIYDSLTIIRSWIERVGYINQAIENVYARLGENIDFDDVAEKVDIIYENISALNNWTMKIDNVDNSMTDLQLKLTSLSEFMDDTKNITNAIFSVKEKLDTTFANDFDFDDVTNKMDIVYESLSSINEWASKIDKIDTQVSTINTAFEDDMISSKIDLVYENIGLLNEWVNKIDNVSSRSDELDFKVNELTETLANASKIIEDVPNIKDKLDSLSSELNAIVHTTRNDADSYIYTLLDIESDFLKLHQFVNDKTENLHQLFDDKTNNLQQILDDKTNSLHQILDSKTSITTQDINSLKEKFEELNNDISSISIRTNKLILSADDANKEFKSHLEVFKGAIAELEAKKSEFNPELKFELISEKITEMFTLMQNSANANKSLNNAFLFLAEWVDATGSLLNTMSADIAQIKTQDNSVQSNSNAVIDDVKLLKDGIANSINKINVLEKMVLSIKGEDIKELKSLLAGVIVHLNNLFGAEDFDALNKKLDKVASENNEKLSSLEVLMREKINQQSQQIASMEEKLETLNKKFDQLVAAMIEDHNNNMQIRDVLKYIATQTAEVNEALSKSKITEVAEKMTSFDENINKIVSYIEED